MAKTSMVNRDLKRTKLVQKYSAKRAELKAVVLSPSSAIPMITFTECFIVTPPYVVLLRT